MSWVTVEEYAAKRWVSEEDCKQHGGHCFERTGFTRSSVPPQYQEVCKHCRKQRWAIPREPFTYVDEDLGQR